MTLAEQLRAEIRNVPDFPKPGIQFKDITTVLKQGPLFRAVADALYELWQSERVDKVVSIESRGFVYGSVLAYRFGAGFVMARKRGKLPAETVAVEYALEYGTDAIEIHADAILPGERVLVHDDVIATGGTAAATVALVEKMGGHVVGCCFLVELADLRGRERLSGYRVTSLVSF
ncbi:MAG: adenine phosphoribosyltransferase [Bacteroidetes bacterium]|nr:adenine phosphoribosyltransferase [Rhodothermia bacterium]MCX7906554.1 adenine phosphoribosyltransferase [Bacteroidota bacterium]MDW8284965.1 adenine phosphoribosyltransferase [Bacteroidota bacterium]